MRIFVANNVTFTYNKDFSGEVVITVPETMVEDGLSGKKLVTMQFSELKRFYLEYLRRQTIMNVEQMSERELDEWATLGKDPRN